MEFSALHESYRIITGKNIIYIYRVHHAVCLPRPKRETTRREREREKDFEEEEGRE